MAVTFQLPSGRALDLVRFAWSPMFEAMVSLPVITHPKRTPMHLPWARRCRELPPNLLAEIHALTGGFNGYVPGVFEIGLLGDSPAFEDELAAFREVDLETFTYEMSLAFGGISCAAPDEHNLALVHDATYREGVLARTAASNPESVDLVRAVFDEPALMRERYAAMVAWYWEAAFREEWERLLPRIETEVTDGARALVTMGVAGLVGALLPEARWEADSSSIVVEKGWESTCDVAARGGMLLVPTVYGWPRVMIELSEPWAPAVFFPLRDLRQPEVPNAADHEVADGLRALGDETRLQIARMVATEPRSTKELAELLKLSDSSVSRHLKILDAAGVVEGERDGYFVLYRLRPERIGQLGGALRHTLGLAQATTGNVPALPVAMSRAALR